MTLANTESELTSEFADTSELGALARGDVFEDTNCVAYYFARWFPERAGELDLLIVLVSNPNHISIGFRVSTDGTVRFADDLWMDWSAHAIVTTATEAQTIYAALGQRARAIAEVVLLQDHAWQTLTR
jgi:hypothetical protein